MRKQDHMVLAEHIAKTYGQDIPQAYIRAYLRGNVAPDENPVTYLHGFRYGMKFHGHNYENILPTIKRLYGSLLKKKSLGLIDYYRLGKLSHYTADSFTYPHNAIFPGSIVDHVKYESVLRYHLEDFLKAPKLLDFSPQQGDPRAQNPSAQRPRAQGSCAQNAEHACDDLYTQFRAFHADYRAAAGEYDTDCSCIYTACVRVFEIALQRSSIIDDVGRVFDEIGDIHGQILDGIEDGLGEIDDPQVPLPNAPAAR